MLIFLTLIKHVFQESIFSCNGSSVLPSSIDMNAYGTVLHNSNPSHISMN
jgi:hypothetical protein